MRKKENPYEKAIEDDLTKAGIEFEREALLISGRKFRVDFFIKPDIVVEFEGAVWIGGRHTRGSGYIKDCEKYNLLTKLGYKVMRYTSESFQEVVSDIKLLQSKNGA